MTMPGRLMRLFVALLCAVCVGCSDTCPGECQCSGIFECDLLTHWPEIPSIGDPARVTQIRLKCVDNGSLGSLGGMEQFTSLTSVVINHCHSLNNIPEGTFAHAPRMVSVDMSSNAIRQVHARSFVGLGKLETLILDANRIDALPARTFHNLTRLKRLKLSNNNIASLATGLFSHNKALVEIDISMNALSEIEADHFGQLHQLQLLVLTSNVIRTLAPGCFDTTSLREIYLSSNVIDYIDGSMFPSHLQKLFASSNRITGLPEALLLKFKQGNSLREFHLGQNPFHCNCEILALVRYIKENKADDIYKCATPFVANLDKVTEANVKCIEPKAEPIEWDDVGNSAICRGSGDPAPLITWTLSNSKTELVRVLPSRNKTVLHTEATLPRSAWRNGSVHVCRVSSAFGQQYETFFLRVNVEIHNQNVSITSPAKQDGDINFTVVIIAVVVTFLVTLLVTAVVTVVVMKRRNVQTPPPSESFDVIQSPDTANDHSSSPGVDLRQDGASRGRRHRHTKHDRTPQSSRNTYTDQHRNSNVPSGEPDDVNDLASPTESVYEALDERTRQSAHVVVDSVYTDLPGGQYQQATVTFDEG